MVHFFIYLGLVKIGNKKLAEDLPIALAYPSSKSDCFRRAWKEFAPHL